MATVTPSEFVKARKAVASFSMLEHKGIFTRLVEEGSLAIHDFTRDPRGFIREIFSDNAKDLQRSKRIRAGLALGLAIQIVLTAAIAIAGWHRAIAITETYKPEYKVDWVDLKTSKSPTETANESSIKNDSSGKKSDVPKGSTDAGSNSGGGGNENPLPATKGVPPPSLPNPAMISPTAPSSQNPEIPVNPYIEGMASLPPPPDATIGSPTGTPNTKSAGPGKGDGIGNGDGSGIGNNKGVGSGNTPNGEGKDNGTKGGRLGSPDGITPTGPIDFGLLKTIPESRGIEWIRRVKPIITPEAQADKITGYVLLYATFNADGTITDIVVRQSLPSMDDAAIAALQKAKFRPAMIKGVPITLRRVPITVNVNLNY